MKQNIFKILLLFFITFFLVCPSQNVFAVSLQLKGGMGTGSYKDEDAEKTSIELDIFLYESKNFQLFLGGEHFDYKLKETRFWYGSDILDSSFKGYSLIMGLQFPITQIGKFRPYLALNAGYGKGDVEIDGYSTGNDVEYLLGRVCAGVDYSINKYLSIGLELHFDYNYYDINFNHFEDENISTMGLRLGARYYF